MSLPKIEKFSIVRECIGCYTETRLIVCVVVFSIESVSVGMSGKYVCIEFVGIGFQLGFIFQIFFR